jgi:phenylpropionate dioxygenase-like ring-hydroxylating dioxygenase large terminal subunit
VATTKPKRTPLKVPHAVRVGDRIPKERYFDPEFFALEVEHLWSRTWQMACRLEEVPNLHDFVDYEILDQSVIVVHTAEGVRAFHNACRHRGVRLVEGPGNDPNGFTCPFHGWCYGVDGVNTFVSRPGTFSKDNLQPGDIDLTPVRCEVWGGMVWINFDDAAPPLRECIEPFATTMDAWHLDLMRAEWWSAFRLPVNWKLAEEAFLEQYHVLETHQQLRIPGRYPSKNGTFDPKEFVRSELQYLHTMSEGMAGMVHAKDVKIAERLKTKKLPADPMEARAAWDRNLNDAVVAWHRKQGTVMPDLNELQANGQGDSMAYCFPHVFVLPMYSSASLYRFRPVAPEETLMEIWSITRYPEGSEPTPPPRPEPMACDDPRVPPIPTQDFSNLPRQQRGLHAKGFEYMRLSAGIEGGVGNFEKTVDGFIAGLPYKKLLPALAQIQVNPLERPVLDLGF